MPSSSGRDGNAGFPLPPPTQPHGTREWAALPCDVIWDIFCRLRHVDILRGAGLACASWRRVAVDEPTLWRSIDLAFDEDDRIDDQALVVRLAMGCAAVDRSAGRCESFRGPANRHLLAYLAASAPSLRRLHVTAAWCVPEAFVDRVITKLPMLERLALSAGLISLSTMRALLKHCPCLELLDAGDCWFDRAMGYKLWRRCCRKIKVLSLPRMVCNYCFCRICYTENHRGRR
ncbi:putative F-box/LRR-repeat protein 23 [Phragmites australis]|uniref:putative F-box/LRR-repeat protein 23 n=1 Tax=Phragmites australis TaxID=29695 RepID=UPI002D78FDC0|nr:putative F-box/LRR-repeat protein 23 [Phragmites australis]